MGMRDRVILTVRDKNGKVKQEYDSEKRYSCKAEQSFNIRLG